MSAALSSISLLSIGELSFSRCGSLPSIVLFTTVVAVLICSVTRVATPFSFGFSTFVVLVLLVTFLTSSVGFLAVVDFMVVVVVFDVRVAETLLSILRTVVVVLLAVAEAVLVVLVVVLEAVSLLALSLFCFSVSAALVTVLVNGTLCFSTVVLVGGLGLGAVVVLGEILAGGAFAAVKVFDTVLVAVVGLVLCDKVVGLGLGAALVTPVVVVFVAVVFGADVSLAGAGLGAAGLVGLDLVVPRDTLVFGAVVVSEVVFLAVKEDLAVDFMSPLVRGFFSVDLGAGVGDGLSLGEVFAAAGLGVAVVGDFAAPVFAAATLGDVLK